MLGSPPYIVSHLHQLTNYITLYAITPTYQLHYNYMIYDHNYDCIKITLHYIILQ